VGQFFVAREGESVPNWVINGYASRLGDFKAVI
jgi:hypothetical protein